MEEKEGTSKEESRLINLILSNGARFYVDHAHPEYSSPETTNPRDLVIWDRAGERILNLSRQRAEAVSPPEQRILIYKNNTDSKGNSYGTHENYLMDRKVPFARIVQHMMPFFVTRQVFTGAGKVGAENNADPCDYQISQRADFLETEVGLETMHSRPIINTRDEPHADPGEVPPAARHRGRRQHERDLHLPQGRHDGHRAEHGRGRLHRARPLGGRPGGRLPRGLARPLAAGRRSGSRTAARITAVDLQREFLALAHRYYRDREHEPGCARSWPGGSRRSTGWPRTRCSSAASSTGSSSSQLIENYMAKHDLEWNDSRVQMIDLQYHDIRPGRGLYYKLEESEAVDRMVTDDEIAKAIYDPPKDTRAYFRGMCLQRYADEIVSASWDSVIFDLKEGPAQEDLHAGAAARHRGARPPAPDRVADGRRSPAQHRAAALRDVTMDEVTAGSSLFDDYSTRASSKCSAASRPHLVPGLGPTPAAALAESPRHHGPRRCGTATA